MMKKVLGRLTCLVAFSAVSISCGDNEALDARGWPPLSATGVDGQGGAAGSAGTSNQGGAAGVSGQGGSVVTGGAAGTAGSSGQGGSSGNGGASGSSGAAGAAGISGNGGAGGSGDCSGKKEFDSCTAEGTTAGGFTCKCNVCVQPQIAPYVVCNNGGAAGQAGSSGQGGSPGNGGAAGSSGAAGASGNSGAAGQAGMAGSSGSAGDGGTSGSSGSSGNGGAAGASGASGASGQAGAAGSSGSGGSAGAGGLGGAAGSAGSGGVAGSSGAAGTSGSGGTGGSTNSDLITYIWEDAQNLADEITVFDEVVNSGGFWLLRPNVCSSDPNTTDIFATHYSWGTAWDCDHNVTCYSQNANGIHGIMCQVERPRVHMLRANVYIVYQNSSLGPWHCDDANGTSKNGSLKILANGEPMFCWAIQWPGGGFNEPNCKIECYLP